MKNTFNYTSRTGNVLSEQLQLLWRYAMVMVAVFAFSANAFAQDPRCDANPADWPALLGATGSTHITDVANATDNSDNQFTQGAKDEDTWLTAATRWHWSLGSANDKGDIQNAGAALVNDCVLRFFGDRTAVNGDASIGFWFFQDPNISLNADGTFNGTRMDGDIFVLVDFLGGGGTAVPTAYVWDDGGLKLLTGATACGRSNSGAIAASDIPWDYDPKFGSGYGIGAFFEGYVDLCGTGLDLCFSTFLVETRNSQELTAALQDFAFGSIDITPLQPLATATDITCTDEESIITVTDPEIGPTYILDGPGIEDPIEITPTAVNPDVEFTVEEVGTYSLIAENSNGCQSDPYQVMVEDDIIPVGIPEVEDEERCGPGTVTFEVTAPLGGVTYRWYDDDDPTAMPVHTGTTYTTNSLSSTTTFWVTATGANGCETTRDEVQAIIFTPVVVDAGGPDTRCQSTSTQVIALTGASITGGANNGTWTIVSSDPANAGNVLSNNTYASGSLTVAANYVGTITLRLTSVDPTGPCGTDDDDRIVTIGPAAVVEAGAPITVCQSASSQNIPLTGASVTGGTSTGTWAIVSSVPANAGNILGNNTLAAGNLTVAANYYGVITLELTSADPDGEGPCEAASDTRTVTINQAVTAEAGDNVTRCQSTSEQIIALGGASVTGGATTGTWSITSATPSAGVTLTNSTVASGSLTIAANYTGVINLTLTSADPDGDGPCLADTDTRTVTIGPAAVVEAGTPITRCQSATSQAIALTGASITGGANTGTWTIVSSVPANAGNMLSNNTYASGSLTVAANYYGVITLQLTSADPDGDGPCQAASDTRTVTIYQNPTVMVAAGTSTCVNNVPTVTITATPSGGSGTGYTYDWTVPAGAVDPGNVASFNATIAGIYSVIVTDSRTCSGSGLVVPLFVPCEMLEGCTPGYWKQAQHFGNWGCDYTTETEFFDVFTGITDYRELAPDMTLLEALELKGGKFQALARHAAAAILNACADVNYKYTNEEIISMVRRSFNSGNWSIVHNLLSAANEMGCPLGRAPLATTSKVKGLQGIETTTDQITAYPTPFSDRAIVEFRMAADESYVVNLYDMKGSLVKQLKAGSAKAGELQQVEVDGRGLGEGLYIARMISDSGARSVKLLLKRE